MKKKDIKSWLKEICRWDRFDWFVKVVKDEDETFICTVYTHDHKYHIVAHDRDNKEKNYLGCTASTRKPRAGEDWERGNDLPDGPYTYKTWLQIKNAIVAYELVKVVRKQKRIVDNPENNQSRPEENIDIVKTVEKTED